MNKLSTYFSRLAMIAIAGFAVSSCTTATGPGGGGTTTVNDGVSANSASSTAINVRWTRSDGADTVIAVNSTTGVEASRAYATSSSNNGTIATINNLSENIMYNISVHGTAGVSQYPVTWMTAARSSSTTRIYETADNIAGQYSGLALSGSPMAMPIAGNQNATVVDLVLASDTSNHSTGLSLISPSVTRLSGLNAGRATAFADTFYSVPQPGLDNLYYTGSLTNQVLSLYTAYDIPAASANGNSEVIALQTADNHYSRIEIVPQPDGRLFGGVAGQNYIDVRVSYQNIVGMAYASRGHAPTLVSGQAKHAIHTRIVQN